MTKKSTLFILIMLFCSISVHAEPPKSICTRDFGADGGRRRRGRHGRYSEGTRLAHIRGHREPPGGIILLLSDSWIGVSTPPGGGNAGQGMFRDLTGFVHHVGIHLSGCRDVNRILDVHWFVGGQDTPGRQSYYRENRVGFEFGDVDGVLMDRCFIIGPGGIEDQTSSDAHKAITGNLVER